MRPTDDEEVPAAARANAFLCALACRILAVTRRQCVESAGDFQGLLQRCIADAEQAPGVGEEDGWWVALLLAAHVQAALEPRDGEPILAVWMRRWREGADAQERTEGHRQARTVFLAWRMLVKLIRGRHRTLLELAGLAWRHRAQAQLHALLDALGTVAEHFIVRNVFPAEDRAALRSLRALVRYYRRPASASHAGSEASPVAPQAPRAPAARPASAGAPDPDGAAARDVAAMSRRVVNGVPLESPTLAKLIRENWSMNKAERLCGELVLRPARPAAIDALAAEFPWMRAAVERVAVRVRRAVLLGQPAFCLPPLLLVDGYGCGKTRFAQRLAEAQGLSWRLMAAGGSADNRQLAGTSRGWSSAYPSLLVDFMGESGVANGLIVIDDVDKESPDRHNGRLTDTLLQLLEPANARNFEDPFLGFAVDCTALNWVLTANALASINAALLARAEVIHVPQPGPEHFPAIASGVRADIARAHAVDPRLLPAFTGEDIELLQAHCRSARDVRRLCKEIVTRRVTGEPDHVLPN